MIDFPASPTVGQAFAGFVYSGTQWQRPKALTETALPKNYILNPAMMVSQENGNTAGTANLYYMVDQWYISKAGADGSAISGQSVASTTPSGSPYRLRLLVTTATTGLVGPSLFQFRTRIEGIRIADFNWGTSSNKPVVLRFGFRGPAGTYHPCISGASAAWLGQFIISAGQANTDTVQVFLVPGTTLGTWVADNTAAINLTVTLAAGTTYNGGVLGWAASNWPATTAQSNGLATVNNIFELFDFGLYADPYNTGIAPPFVVPDYAQELRRCQRYWYKGFGWSSSAGSATVAGRMAMRHQVPMRATPTATIAGTPKLYDSSVTPTITSLATACNSYAAEFDVTASAGGMTPGRAVQMFYQTDNDYIAMNARM